MNFLQNRESVLAMIADTIQSAIEDGPAADTPHFAATILDGLEARCVGRVKGELMFGDDDADALMEGA